MNCDFILTVLLIFNIGTVHGFPLKLYSITNKFIYNELKQTFKRELRDLKNNSNTHLNKKNMLF